MSRTRMQRSTSRPRLPYWSFPFHFCGNYAFQYQRRSLYTCSSALEFCESPETISLRAAANIYRVIAIAVARLPSLKNVDAAKDPTYLNQGPFYWSCAETSVAHVCATALTIRPLYLKLHAKFIERKRRKNSASSSPDTDGAMAGSILKPGNASRPHTDCHQVEWVAVRDWPHDI